MVSQEISFFQTMVPLQQKNFYIYECVNYLYETLELENVNLIEKYADSCAWSMEFWNYSNHAATLSGRGGIGNPAGVEY